MDDIETYLADLEADLDAALAEGDIDGADWIRNEIAVAERAGAVQEGETP